MRVGGEKIGEEDDGRREEEEDDDEGLVDESLGGWRKER